MSDGCVTCGSKFRIGDTVIEMPNLFKDKSFCSYSCAKTYLSDHLDEVLEENTEEYTQDSDDPYDTYGVSEFDFL